MAADRPTDDAKRPMLLIAPAVASRAAELGIPVADLAGVTGSGPGGRLRPDDLASLAARRPKLAAAPDTATVSSAPAAPPGVSPTGAGGVTGWSLPGALAAGRTRSITVPLSRRRTARARDAMLDATTAADLTSAVEVDLTALIAPLERSGRGAATSPDTADMLLGHITRAVLTALGSHPTLNARIEIDADGGRTILRDTVHLGVVMSGPRGDVRSVLRGAEELNHDDLRAQLGDIGLLARAGIDDAVSGDAEAAGIDEATFTIFDRRAYPLLFETPPLPRGCSGALAIGAVEKRPVVDVTSGAIKIVWASYLCLTYDHRLVDGADAARFLGDLAHLLARDTV